MLEATYVDHYNEFFEFGAKDGLELAFGLINARDRSFIDKSIGHFNIVATINNV